MSNRLIVPALPLTASKPFGLNATAARFEPLVAFAAFGDGSGARVVDERAGAEIPDEHLRSGRGVDDAPGGQVPPVGAHREGCDGLGRNELTRASAGRGVEEADLVPVAPHGDDRAIVGRDTRLDHR